MTTSTASEEPAATPLLDLHPLVVAVRRRRRMWGATALLGLLLGAALAVLLPPPPTAQTKLLVAHVEDQPNDPGTLIRTDVEVLSTTRVAELALKNLGSAARTADFMKDYRGTGITNNLLRIDVSGSTGAQAKARARALADAFIADHVRRMKAAAKAEAKALLDQRDRRKKDLAKVNEEIGGRTPENAPDASADLESLFARRAELTSKIEDYQQQAEEAGIGTPKIVAGTQIVDAPRVVARSLDKTVVKNAAIGLVLGLVVGLAIAAVGAVVADRPVLRKEIAANLGSSITAELPRRSRLPATPWQRHRTRVAHERLTATLARSVRGSSEEVSLLELGCARSTSTIALDLGRALAADGPVTLIDGLPGPQLSGHRRQPGDPSVVSGAQAATVPQEVRRLGVGSVAPGTAWSDLRQLGTRTVLVVRAGHGSAAWLHTVARQLADQHIPLLAVVLVDPDPRDRTDGTLWDGQQSARSGPLEPPARRNGVDLQLTERRPTWAAGGPDSGDQEGR